MENIFDYFCSESFELEVDNHSCFISKPEFKVNLLIMAFFQYLFCQGDLAFRLLWTLTDLFSNIFASLWPD